jgi:hypothetical protein
MNAGRKSYGDYIEEMQRSERPAEGDLVELVDAELARLESAYTKDVLHALIASGGEGERL